jgi:hypothetical protein
MKLPHGLSQPLKLCQLGSALQQDSMSEQIGAGKLWTMQLCTATPPHWRTDDTTLLEEIVDVAITRYRGYSD